MKNILCYSPKVRFSPFDALRHSFFNELRDEKTYKTLQKQYNIDSLFDFSETREAPYE